MSLPILNLIELRQRLEDFANLRDWEQYHTPKNLAMALSVEASELVEIFQWMSEKQQKEGLDEQTKQKVAHELSDILVYLLRMTHVLEIDLPAALDEKLELNAKKYPAEQVRGSSKKYDQY